MSDDHDVQCKWKLHLDAQLEIETYRNDLVDTLKELLVSKEALIAEMRERNNK